MFCRLKLAGTSGLSPQSGVYPQQYLMSFYIDAGEGGGSVLNEVCL